MNKSHFSKVNIPSTLSTIQFQYDFLHWIQDFLFPNLNLIWQNKYSFKKCIPTESQKYQLLCTFQWMQSHSDQAAKGSGIVILNTKAAVKYMLLHVEIWLLSWCLAFLTRIWTLRFSKGNKIQGLLMEVKITVKKKPVYWTQALQLNS